MNEIVEGFRNIVRDLLVPELKAVQNEVKHVNEKISALDRRIDVLHQEMGKRFDLVHQEMDKRFEVVHQEMDKRFEVVHQEMDKRFDLVHQEMNKRFEEVNRKFDLLHDEFMDFKITQREILSKIDFDKRITRLEALVEHISRKAA